MDSRDKRARIAKKTTHILKSGNYPGPDGTTVSIAGSLRQARADTVLYTPKSFPEAFVNAGGFVSATGNGARYSTEFRVVNCRTLSAARRIVDADPSQDPVCLNFASAKNPGGGFLNGSQAQEESIARASGLYACISPVHEYYQANRRCGTCLYTHHMIYSPRVPVFRDDDDELLQDPYCVSIITAPAVNAGAVLRNERKRRNRIESTMLERIEMLLTVALHHGHDTIILGAWGCGVFRNDPDDVAGWFHSHLTGHDWFKGAFRRVIFAVLDQSKRQGTLAAFERRFSAATSDI